MAPSELTHWVLNPIYLQARHNQHRRLLVVSGDNEWVNHSVQSLLSEVPSSLVVKEIGSKNSLIRKHLLGNECDIAVVHSHQGFTPGNVMAITGTIRWGGCLILCCPALESWHLQTKPTHLSHGFIATESLYIKRLVEIIKNDVDVAIWDYTNCHIPILESKGTFSSLSRASSIKRMDAIYPINLKSAKMSQHRCSKEVYESPFKSLEQQDAFHNLTDIWRKDIRKAVITAPRGRGKSALVGMFVASRLVKGEKVLITSSIRENTTTLFKHIRQGIRLRSSAEQDHHITLTNDNLASTNSSAAKACDDETVVVESIHSKKSGSAQWLAPDNPALVHSKSDLLIIDEAASFPLPVLKLLLNTHNNWVISTTLQGYEGSGQGFMQRMLPALHREGAQHLSLSTPLRWRRNDKLESLIHHICLFEETDTINTPFEDTTDRLDADYKISLMSALPKHELHSVMQLLAIAHYQTTPDDFMRLCDSPDILLFTQWYASRLIAAAVVNCEGGEPLADLQKEIAEGSRRPKGHLGAQRLTLLTADPQTAVYRYWRINRIAVTPYLQDQGRGTQLMGFICAQAITHDIDALTSSYGTSDKLNYFWKQCGFTLVDKGEKPNKASGETSALVIKAISERYRPDQEILANLFTHSQETEMLPMGDLPSNTRKILLKKLMHFVNATRPISQVKLAINALAADLLRSRKYAVNTQSSAKTSMLETDEITPELLLLLSTTPLPTKQLIEHLKLSGRKALTESLREKVRCMLDL